MNSENYTLDAYVDELRKITASEKDEKAIISAVRPLASRLAVSKSWLQPIHYECDDEQGFGVHLLHEEPDHRLAVFAVSWLPGRGAPPHDHGTWAVVAGVDGAERNIFWERLDDRSREGYAELERIGDKVFDAGEVVAMPTGTLHSVDNDSDAVTVSLHTYGMHVNHTDRSQFDPVAKTATPFILKQR